MKEKLKSLRSTLRKVRPCIKGSLIAAVSTLLTHKDIGIGQITTNIIFGGIAYFFLAFAGLIVINDLKQGKKIFGVSLGIGIGLTVFNVILFNLNIVSIIFALIIGLIWLILVFNVNKKRLNLENVTKLVASLAFSLGIIYGAFLNTYLIPFFVIYFFITVSFLQVSRELIKGYINKKEKEMKEGIITRIKARNKKETTAELVKQKKEKIKALRAPITTQEDKKILKKTLFLYIVAILFIILTVFSDITYPVFFMFLSILGLACFGLATFLTWKTILNEQFYNKLGLLSKFGFFLVIVAFIMAS